MTTATIAIVRPWYTLPSLKLSYMPNASFGCGRSVAAVVL